MSHFYVDLLGLLEKKIKFFQQLLFQQQSFFPWKGDFKNFKPNNYHTFANLYLGNEFYTQFICSKGFKVSKLNKHSKYGITRGQRPYESQKAVIIYMMKPLGEIAS